MKKLFFISTFFCLFVFHTQAQITGSDTVCAGYIYTYDATIAGADSFAWTLPPGWYVLSGEGTSQVQVLCNQNIGQVCASGYDTAGNFISQFCYNVAWGGGGIGWDVYLNQIAFCGCGIFTVSIVPNGTGNCGGCGSGFPSPNIRYAVYDNIWGFGNFVIYADGVTPIGALGNQVWYYVYCVDITFGINNAILIEGGNCPAQINNSFPLGPCFPPVINAVQDPSPACIGDTVTMHWDGLWGPFSAFSWSLVQGNVTMIPPYTADSVQCIVNASGAVQLLLQVTDNFGCMYSGFINVTNQACNTPPVASFSAVTNPICPGTCTGFSNLSANATSYQWTFSGANPGSSTDVNPSSICYNMPGSYDVMLVAANSFGTDTISLPGYITVLPYPPPQSILYLNDTLFSNQGFTSYQWFVNGNLISGATNYFFVPLINGDYNVISQDANGCEVEAAIFNILLSTPGDSHDQGLSFMVAQGQLIIRSSGSVSQDMEVSIYDLSGRKIFGKNLTVRSGYHSFTFDAGDLPDGIYILQARMGEKLFCRKLPVQD